MDTPKASIASFEYHVKQMLAQAANDGAQQAIVAMTEHVAVEVRRALLSGRITRLVPDTGYAEVTFGHRKADFPWLLEMAPEVVAELAALKRRRVKRNAARPGRRAREGA